MPKIVKMYEESKGSLEHNQGPVSPTRMAMGARPPRKEGLMSCRAKCNKFLQSGDMDAYEKCMRTCQAKFISS